MIIKLNLKYIVQDIGTESAMCAEMQIQTVGNIPTTNRRIKLIPSVTLLAKIGKEVFLLVTTYPVRMYHCQMDSSTALHYFAKSAL